MKTIEFRQRNMYCNACLANVINAILGIKGVYEFNIDMKNKTIHLQLENETMGKKKIQELINVAITTGQTTAMVYTH